MLRFVQRVAPDGGYRFLEKKLYRQHVWNLAKRQVGRDGHILLMPSIEGDEIRFAAKKGFRPSRMHVVDKNPAIVATLAKRVPGINTYGVTLSDACARMAKRGVRLSAANFDLCGNISDSLISEVRAAASADCWATSSCVFVTVLRGRETPEAMTLIREAARIFRNHERFSGGTIPSSNGEEFSNRDRGRIWLLLDAVRSSYSDTVQRAGIYLSPAAGQTMLWVCFKRYASSSKPVSSVIDRREDLLRRAKELSADNCLDLTIKHLIDGPRTALENDTFDPDNAGLREFVSGGLKHAKTDDDRAMIAGMLTALDDPQKAKGIRENWRRAILAMLDRADPRLLAVAMSEVTKGLFNSEPAEEIWLRAREAERRYMKSTKGAK